MKRRLWVWWLVIMVLCAGCARSQPTPPLASASATPRPSATATATQTVQPSATATATATPSPTATSTPGPAPMLAASYPVNGDRAVPTNRDLSLVFSQAMETSSVTSRLQISPSIEIETHWTTSNTLVLHPLKGWPVDTPLSLTLAPGGQSLARGILAEPQQLDFASGGPGAWIPILMYHQIKALDADASETSRTWTVSPQAFEEQMDYLLDHGWHSISPGQLAAYLLEGQALPPKAMMITMDDGYKEVHSLVLPLLRETRLRPVIFAIPSYMGYGAYLNWEQLTELSTAGFWIGVHGYDHTNLREHDADGLAIQLDSSKNELEAHLGISLDAFCFPFGSYDERTLAALAQYGYSTAYTLNPTSYQDPAAPYQLGRRRIDYDTTIQDFAALLPD